LLSDAVYFFPGLHGSAEVWASFCVSGIRAVDVDVGASWSISSSAVAAMERTLLTRLVDIVKNF